MKSLQIAETLKQDIRKKRMAPGTPVMSNSQIASHFKVSLMTAHKALSYLEEQQIIIRQQGKGSFVRPCHSESKKLVIGCALDQQWHNSEPIKKMLMGIFSDVALNYFQTHNCTCRLIPYALFNRPEYWEGLDGVLVSISLLVPETEKILLASELPVVLFRSEYQMDLPFSQVVPDLSIAMRQIFAAIRKPYAGFVTVCHEHDNGRARAEAFIKAAIKAGYPASLIESHIVGESGGYRLGLSLAETCSDKLIFSCSDLLTFDLMDAMRDKGVKYGDDYEIIGFDNLEETGILPWRKPVVTAVDYSRKSAAMLAARTLISQIINKNNYQQIIKIPTRLIIRESALTERKK